MTTGRDDDALATFQGLRPRLFGIAYRMLGSVQEAEDLVQETWLRWHGSDRAAVREPAAYLATTVTRLALDALGSARARREEYIGPWLPEPVATGDDPTLGAERAEAMSLAVLLLLERLSPGERAAFVLHEAFDYPFREIARMLETSEANARQLASRARAHLDRERAAPVPPGTHARLLEALTAAARDGDLVGLEALLLDDAVSLSDGGGVVRAARKAVHGRERVAQFVLGVLAKFGEGIEPVAVEANGEAAILGMRDGAPVGMWTVEAGPEGIRRLLIVLNPEKLGHLVSRF